MVLVDTDIQHQLRLDGSQKKEDLFKSSPNPLKLNYKLEIP